MPAKQTSFLHWWSRWLEEIIEILLRCNFSYNHHQIRVAAVKSVTAIASGTQEQRTRLRNSLLPRLDQASDNLRDVAADCLSRGLAHDLLKDGELIQVFRTIDHADIRVREPVVAELQAYI